MNNPMSNESPKRAAGEDADTLTQLAKANLTRSLEWQGYAPNKQDVLFCGLELGGESGEAQNVIKKLWRGLNGWAGGLDEATAKEKLAEELADVVICAERVAACVGINLTEAIPAKFNATSKKNGLKTVMSAALAPSFPMTSQDELKGWRSRAELAEERLIFEQEEARQAMKTLDNLNAPTNGEEGHGKRQSLTLSQRIAYLQPAPAPAAGEGRATAPQGHGYNVYLAGNGPLKDLPLAWFAYEEDALNYAASISHDGYACTTKKVLPTASSAPSPGGKEPGETPETDDALDKLLRRGEWAAHARSLEKRLRAALAERDGCHAGIAKLETALGVIGQKLSGDEILTRAAAALSAHAPSEDGARLERLASVAGFTICHWYDGYQVSRCCTESHQMTGKKFPTLREALDDNFGPLSSAQVAGKGEARSERSDGERLEAIRRHLCKVFPGFESDVSNRGCETLNEPYKQLVQEFAAILAARQPEGE